MGWDAKFGLVKINPLLSWTQRDVWAFIVANHVPYNPLHDQGYPSIGCWPCTQPRGRRRGRAGGPMGGPGQDGVRAALARQQPALTMPERRAGHGWGIGGPMKISAKAEYACLAVLALAQQGPDASAAAHPRDLGVARRSPSATWCRSCSS